MNKGLETIERHNEKKERMRKENNNIIWQQELADNDEKDLRQGKTETRTIQK
jgi:hypothetical protein